MCDNISNKGEKHVREKSVYYFGYCHDSWLHCCRSISYGLVEPREHRIMVIYHRPNFSWYNSIFFEDSP